MHRFSLFSLILRRPEDGGGTPPPADTAPPPAAAAASAAADTPPAAAADPWRPDGLPDDLAGASDRETAEKLWTAYQARTAPGEPADYVLDLTDRPEGLRTAFANPDDPLYSAARAAAAKHGIAKDAFAGFLADTFGPAFEQGILPAPFDPAKELQSFGTAIGVTDRTELGKRHGELVTFAKGLGAQMELSDGEQVELDVLTDTAAGLTLLGKLRAHLGDGGGPKMPAPGASSSSGTGMSKDELHRLDADDRIDPGSPKYDPALRRAYDAAYRRHYG